MVVRAAQAVQALELSAGALNLFLMGRNMRDGLLMTAQLTLARADAKA